MLKKSEEFNRVLNYFNWQIGKNKSKAVVLKSKVDRELFMLDSTLDLDDWKIIRGGTFWTSMDNLSTEHERNFFTLQKVKLYLRDKS